MDLQLKGMRALVCGASRGLGAAIARELAAEGSAVAVAARTSTQLDEMARDIGGTAVAVDLSQRDGAETALKLAAEGLGGPVDLLVVNSGGPPSGKFQQLEEGDWEAALNGTLLAAIRLIRYALPQMRSSQHEASILVILSSSVREPIPGLVTSNVLRPALAGLIKSLAQEIAPIRINGLAPGRIYTDRLARLEEERARDAGVTSDELMRRTIERIPASRYGEPREIARAAAFLLSPAASYINSQILLVDGGMVKALI